MADALKDIQELYRDALDAAQDQRKQVEEDLRFSDPSDPQQWDAEIERARKADPGGSRPCLVFDQLGQYVSNVAGQVEQRPPSLHSVPVDGGADKKVAEQLDGFFRQIEYASRASQHYARALTSAARVGVGYLVVRPTYVNRALGWQEPRIGSEGDPLRVVFDPWSVELDGSDATFGFILTPFSHREFSREFGEKAIKQSFGENTEAEDDRESVTVAECWKQETERVNCVVFIGADGEETELPEDDYWAACKQAGTTLQTLRTYKSERKVVKWSRMSGAAILTPETVYPAENIGIVPVYGYVGWSAGRMRYCGIPRRAMNAQRSYNFHMSEMHAYMATAPKSPWITSVRAIAGLEVLWDRASADTRANLPYNDIDETGQPIAPPFRSPVSTNLQNHQQGAEQAVRDIQAAIGMYQANLGAPSNESSGVAIDSRKEQGEASTAHFPAHLAAGIGQVGKLVMEMIPKLIDSKRQLRILGFDGSPSTVKVDPAQAEALAETPTGLVINPNIGRYDMRVVVGASFSTQRQQAQTAFTEMMRANPDMTPALAPLWAQTLDVPNADKLAQVLTAVAPPEVRAILSPESDKQPSTADLMAKVSELQAGLQEAIQHAQEAQQEADEMRQKSEALESDREIAEGELQIKSQEVGIKQFDAETKRLQAIAAQEKARMDAEMARRSAELGEIQAAHAMDTPDEEEAMPAEPAAPPEVPAEVKQLAKTAESLSEQQQQTTQLLKELIRLVQAPRKREPVYDKNGEISGSVDRIDLAASPTIQ